MKYGLDESQKFYVEYTACPRPIGNAREELEFVCQQLANEGKILISLSSGLDSQILLHTFATLNLPYECAFRYHPGYNDIEYNRIKLLENKYGFKTIIITIDPDQHRNTVEELAIQTFTPPEHYIMKMFVEQLPDDRDILTGIESFDFVFKDNMCYCLESWNSIEITRLRTLNQINRKGKIVSADRLGKFNEFALAYLTDPIVNAYLYSLPYTINNGLVDRDSKTMPQIPFLWNYYVKPFIIGKYWKDELEYFPQFASEKKVPWIVNPDNTAFRHQYLSNCVYIERRSLINHLRQWGSSDVKRWSSKLDKLH